MNKIEQILENYSDENILSADGFDDAILGIDNKSCRLIYSTKKCIEILISEDMSEEDALEHFYFNIEGAYVGEKTPIWCNDDVVLYNI
jgi:hypothetical protein